MKKNYAPANANDRVIERAEGFYIIVNGKTIGFWRSRREAEGGLHIEQKRAAARVKKILEAAR